MDPIVEEELIDNHETETPIGGYYESKKVATPLKNEGGGDEHKSQSRIANNDNIKASSRPASEVKKKDSHGAEDPSGSNGFRH